MSIENVREKLAAIASKEPSKWLNDARLRNENKAWLKRSQSIALRILRTLRAKGMAQSDLAKKINVSPQQVSKIVKGRENITLETISKIEDALGVVLIEVPTYQASVEFEPQNVSYKHDFPSLSEMLSGSPYDIETAKAYKGGFSSLIQANTIYCSGVNYENYSEQKAA